MKKKYRSTDSRTGYSEGSVIELDDHELNMLPFNVYMEYVGPVEVVQEAASTPIVKSRHIRRMGE